MTNPNWPLTITSVAFTTDPFDSTATPVFQDMSDRVKSLDSSAGRQYELDTIQSAVAAVTVYDPDEALNPSNNTSPHYPDVKVYRLFSDQAMWPLAPNTMGVGANILNPFTGGGFNTSNTTAGLDPSFEIYGASVSWGKFVGQLSAFIEECPYP